MEAHARLYLKAIATFLLIAVIMYVYHIGSILPQAPVVITQASIHTSRGWVIIAEVIIGIVSIVTLFIVAKKKKWVLFRWGDKTFTVRHLISFFTLLMFLVAILTFENIYTSFARIFPPLVYGALLWLFVILALLFLWVYEKKRQKHLNFITVVIISGYSLLLGIGLTPLILMILLCILAVYDFIAVFKLSVMKDLVNISMFDEKYAPLPMMITTGDMSKMEQRVKEISKKKDVKVCVNCNNLLLPKKTDDGLLYTCDNCGREVLDTNAGKKEVKKEGDKKAKKMYSASALGNGDIIFPAALMVSAFIANTTSWLWLVILGGALIGLAMDMIWANKLKRAIPALPLIAISIGILWLLFIIL